MAYREYTRKLLEAVQEGMIDRDTVIVAALNHLSESEVKDMCEANGFFEHDEEVEDEDISGEHIDNPNWVGSRHHY